MPTTKLARLSLLPVCVLFLVAAPVRAHHSFAAEFDAQKPLTLKGTVVKWEMINPHGWITLDVAAPDGSKVFAGSAGTPGAPEEK